MPVSVLHQLLRSLTEATTMVDVNIAAGVALQELELSSEFSAELSAMKSDRHTTPEANGVPASRPLQER